MYVVPEELRYFRFYMLHMRKLVIWVERVRRHAGGLELNEVWLGAIDVLVRQVVFGLVQT